VEGILGATEAGSARSSRLAYRAVIGILAAFLALLSLTSLRWPFSWDHGIFAWVGDEILRGGMPYRDAWDFKGPLIYYVFAAVEGLTGKSMWGIRVFDLLVLAAAGMSVARIAEELGGRGVGALTALAFSLQYLGTGYFETAQPDGWAGALLVMSFVPLTRDERGTSASDVILSSLLTGSCVLVKPTYATFLGVPLVYVLLSRCSGFPQKLRLAGLAALAFVVPSLVAVGWFAWRGALNELTDTFIGFAMAQALIPVPGVDSSFRGTLFRFAHRIYANPATVCGLIGAFVALFSLWRTRPRSAAVLVAGLGFSFFSVYVQQRYWNRYQWHPAYMTLTLLAGIGVGRLWHDGPRRGARVVAVGLGIALLITLTHEPARQVYRWGQLQLGYISDEQYDAEFQYETSGITVDRRLAAYVRSHTQTSDRVLIWSDPLVNFLSDRAAPGRFGMHGGLNAPILTQYNLRYRSEFMRSLSASPPRLIAVGTVDLDRGGPYRNRNIGHQFPLLRDYLLNEYQPVARFGDMEVWERTRIARQ